MDVLSLFSDLKAQVMVLLSLMLLMGEPTFRIGEMN